MTGMKVLVIGGRQFLGRHIVECLRKQNCTITLFNRGKTNSELFRGLEIIQGDRQKDFHLFEGRKWDVVIDTCGYFPADVSRLAHALRDKADHYIFISSVSVYDSSIPGAELDEDTSPVSLDIDEADTSVNTYGARKFLCEKAVGSCFGERATYVRPGLIVGPYDTTYRFPYWVDRISEGGNILAPGESEAPLQFIDARDLAEWIVRFAPERPMGAVNAVGPAEESLQLGRFLETAIAVLNPKARLTWVPESVLRENEVGCWVQLPLWLYKEAHGFMRRSSAKARGAGLTYRPIEETLRDTRRWSSSVDLEKLRALTLTREKEKEILAAFQKSPG